MGYFMDVLISGENEKYSGENIMITWFLKNQFINWNIECAILLICEFQEYCSNKSIISDKLIEFIYIFLMIKTLMKMKAILEKIE